MLPSMVVVTRPHWSVEKQADNTATQHTKKRKYKEGRKVATAEKAVMNCPCCLFLYLSFPFAGGQSHWWCQFFVG